MDEERGERREETKMIPYNKKLVSNARTLRKNMTPEEKHLWYDFLKQLPFNVRRQHNIENYIVDFYIAKKKLVIEVDGRQHLSPEHKKSRRTKGCGFSRLGNCRFAIFQRCDTQSFFCGCSRYFATAWIGFFGS